MKTEPISIGSGPSAATEEVDALISELRGAIPKVEQQEGRVRAEFVAALARAENLKTMLCSKEHSAERRARIKTVLHYLLEFVKLLCPFIDCFFPRRRRFEDWVDHTASEKRHGHVPDLVGRQAWGAANVPVAS